MAKKPTIEHIDELLAKLMTRLKRTINKMDTLEKQKKRLVKAAANPPQPKSTIPLSSV